ncbi:hypothetical protein J7I98_25735 [Streptomyces sp. ISL-98]|uniref:hypothetical protein n=1 Tax=Streptomyces sp. ISL-98 TaxID=2819192 RepID=UPI001BE4F436|nr:hypothetical protein [Streptomyces sp. ISL-98]MBT2509222.1 hypothetical protein [Streptomyces sp. ISL-98]
MPVRPARRTLPLIAAALTVALAATACTNDDSDTSAKKTAPNTTAASTPTPALSPAQASDAITHYSNNNLAHMNQDRALLDTVEGGPRYAMSLADIKQDEALPKADREPYRPWSYDLSATDLYIPRLKDGQQRWFAAVTKAGSQQQYARVLVLAENTKSKQWEMVATVDIDDPKQLPQIVLDKDGYATAVDAASNSLAAPVGVLHSAVTDNFATGGEMTGKKVFTSTETSRRQIKVHDETTGKFGPRGTTRFASVAPQFTDTYALKTTKGALVIFSHTHSQHDAVTAPGLGIVPEKHDRAWLGTTPSPAFTYTFTCSDIAAVPSTPDPSSLLGYGCRRTDAEAAGPSTSV